MFQAVIPLLDSLEVDSTSYRLGLSQVTGHIVVGLVSVMI